MSKYRKAMIIPYFGKLPKLLDIWMYTCSFNLDYDFFIFTDDTFPISHPANVFFLNSSLNEIRLKCSSIVGFLVELNSPYKLCDYRPAYGEIFYHVIKEYDFWGYCDLDLIFGKISNFITDEILDKYAKILTLGHFTLYKNDQQINSLYRLGDSCNFYKKVFTSNENFIFDEGKYEALIPVYRKKGLFPVWLYDDRYNINCIFSNNNIPIYVNFDIIADINILQNNIQLVWGSCIDYKDKIAKASVFYWNDGELLRIYLDNQSILNERYIYIHLQKRKIDIKVILPKKKFVVFSNSIEESPNKFTELFLKHANINQISFSQYRLHVKTWIFHNGHRFKMIIRNYMTLILACKNRRYF